MSVNKNTATAKPSTVKALVESLMLTEKENILGMIDKHLLENFAPALVAAIASGVGSGKLNENVSKVSVSKTLKAAVMKALNESEEEGAEKEVLESELEDKKEALEEAKLTESKLIKHSKALNEAKEEAEADDTLTEEEKEEITKAIKEDEQENRKALTESRKNRRLIENEIDAIVDELQDLEAMSTEDTGIDPKDTLVENEEDDAEISLEEEEESEESEMNEEEEESEEDAQNEEEEDESGKELYESVRKRITGEARKNKSLLEGIKADLKKNKQLDAKKK